MTKLDNVYVIDSLENIGAYAAVGPHVAAAIERIHRGGLDGLPAGRIEIDGDNAWVNVVDAELVAPADRRGELHKVYFDIQVPLGGDEVIGVARRDASVPMEFDEANDIGFCDQPLEWLPLRVGEFALLWPGECVHAPACTDGEPHRSRKLIFKARA